MKPRRPLHFLPLALLIGCTDLEVSTAPHELSFDLQPQGATIMVANLHDSGDGSLRAALQAAGNGHVISFASGLSGGTLALASELVIEKSVSIVGPAAGVTISGGNATRIFRIGSVSQVTLANLTLRDGYAPNTGIGGGFGGAILNLGNLTIRNSNIEGSWAETGGGGIGHANASLTIVNSTIAENGVNPAGAITSFGGGIRLQGGTLTLANSTVSGNMALSDGGGINNVRGALNLVHSTVAGNGANQGGGISNVGSDQQMAYATLLNSIVAGNVAGAIGSGPDIQNLSISGGDPNSVVVLGAGYTLVGSGVGHNLTEATENLIGTDPRFVVDGLGRPALAANGGYTRTHALLGDSPAIGWANLDECLAAPIGGLDQRGLPRDHANGCDLGAYESQAAAPPVDPAVVTHLSIDATGSVNRNTGGVVLTGRTTCSTPGPVELKIDIQQEQKQRQVTHLVTGTASVVVSCDGATHWAAAINGSNGIFVNSPVAAKLEAIGAAAPPPATQNVRLFWSR